MENKKNKINQIELANQNDLANEPELANTKEIIEKTIMEAEKQEHICDLCARHRPIFVVDTDDMIKRMPERHLSPLLKSLKNDYINKRTYLKFLRIHSRFIYPCKCENKY